MWGLTLHILGIALLFGYFHLPLGVVRVVAAWKETAALVLFAIVALCAGTGRGARSTVGAADLFAGGWLALALVFFATENVLLRDFIPTSAAVFGLRDAAFFLVFYFIGRSTPEVSDDYNVMKHCFLILLVTSSIAIAEQLFVSPQMLVAIGVASYAQSFLGGGAFTQGNEYGLPDNYWSQMGGHFVRRSGSVFLSGQGFAVIFVVLMPLATLWLLRPENRNKWLPRAAYALIWTGLIVTFTRTAILVAALQVLLILSVRRRVTGAALMASAALCGLVAVVAAFPSAATFVFETLTWQSGSSVSHLKDWVKGTVAFLEQPWGYGLGTTDQTAVRAGLDPLTADNLYLKYAVELGLPGLVALLGTLGCIAGAALRVARLASSQSARDLGAAVLLIVLGVFIYGMTSTMFNDPIVGCLTFWLGGTVVTVAQRAHRGEVVPAPLAYA
ncbi:MAG: O-antigen ligase family protein [Gemmatimonadota bacterium]|nr:O-antigen ligase family protein [Gemmatimonadota bacterium]